MCSQPEQRINKGKIHSGGRILWAVKINECPHVDQISVIFSPSEGTHVAVDAKGFVYKSYLLQTSQPNRFLKCNFCCLDFCSSKLKRNHLKKNHFQEPTGSSVLSQYTHAAFLQARVTLKTKMLKMVTKQLQINRLKSAMSCTWRVWCVVTKLVNASHKEREGKSLIGLLIFWCLHWKRHFFSLGLLSSFVSWLSWHPLTRMEACQSEPWDLRSCHW